MLLYQPESGASHYQSYDLNPTIFPPKGALESDLLRYRDRLINPWSIYRNSRLAQVAQDFCYYLGQQWSECDTDGAFDGIRGAILRGSNFGMPDNMPQPTTNEVDPTVEQTVLAMVRREWTFKSVPKSNDPAIKAAAQVATDVMQSRLEALRWPEKRQQHGFQFVLGGTGLIYTNYDCDYKKVRPVGSTYAVHCGSCNTKLYSPDVPLDTLKAPNPNGNGRPVSFLDAAKPTPMESGEYEDVEDPDHELNLQRLSYCPQCEDAQQLNPYTPTPEEASEGNDYFGRAMGHLEPIKEPALEVDDVFEFYPQDGGHSVQPDTLRRFGRRKMRTRDWVEERAPHLIDQLEPDTVQELLFNDPLLGSWDMQSRWSSRLDIGVLDDSFNIDEMVEEPSIRYPLGRYVLATKDRVLIDDDLLVPADIDASEDYDDEMLYVARAQMHIARFKLRPREIWGTGVASILISPQNRLNIMDGQIIHTRNMIGSADVWMPADMWVDTPPVSESAYGAGKTHFYQQSPSMPEVTKPEISGLTLFPDSVYEERDRVLTDMKRLGAPKEATRGDSPAGVRTTSGLQFLADQDMESQSLRETALVRSCERMAGHILRMEWLLRVQDTEYRIKGKDGTFSYLSYSGAKLRGQVDTEIQRGSSISKGVMQREAAREALADRLFDTSSPLTRRKLLELYGLDPDLAPETMYQVDHAERVWADFKDHARVRVQDTLDESVIHYLVLQHHLRTEEGEKIADDVKWDEILRAVAGWQDELRRTELADRTVIEYYGGRLNEEQGNLAYGQALDSHAQKLEVFDQQVALREGARQDPASAAMMGMPPLPPIAPPPPKFLPALFQDRIILVWAQLLLDKGVPEQMLQAQPPGTVAVAGNAIDLPTFLKFRALVEAYRLTATGWLTQIEVEASEAAAAMQGGGSAGPGSGQQDPNAPPSEASGAPAPAPDGGSGAPPTSDAPPSVPGPASLPEGGA